jgi:hypothetical protein
MALTNTSPASICSMNLALSAASRVHTLAPRPKGMSLATRTASLASVAWSNTATGPKSSSR